MARWGRFCKVTLIDLDSQTIMVSHGPKKVLIQLMRWGHWALQRFLKQLDISLVLETTKLQFVNLHKHVGGLLTLLIFGAIIDLGRAQVEIVSIEVVICVEHHLLFLLNAVGI
jgi:hypothetical protein